MQVCRVGFQTLAMGVSVRSFSVGAASASRQRAAADAAEKHQMGPAQRLEKTISKRGM